MPQESFLQNLITYRHNCQFSFTQKKFEGANERFCGKL